MKTQNVLKKLIVLIGFVVILFNGACADKPKPNESMSDIVRQSHSEELLKEQVEKPTQVFIGDRKFASYIKKFLKTKSKTIDSDVFTEQLFKVSEAHSYDPVFLLAVIKTESSFNPNAIGGAGEIGLMQLKPATAKWIAEKNNLPWLGKEALKNPDYNVLIGSYYFQYLKEELDSDSLRYVNAYNMGLGTIYRSSDNRIKQHPYFIKVIKNYLSIYKELKQLKNRKV